MSAVTILSFLSLSANLSNISERYRFIRERYSCTQLGANVELDTFYTYDELDRTLVRSFFLDREPGFTGFWLVRRPTLTRHIAAYFPFKATEIDPLS